MRTGATVYFTMLWMSSLSAPQNQRPAELVEEAHAALAKDPANGRGIAERLLRQSLDLWRKSPGAETQQRADASVTLALLLLGDRRPSQEIHALADEALQLYQRVEDAKLALALEVKAAASDSASMHPLRKRASAIRTRIIHDRSDRDDEPRQDPDFPVPERGTTSAPIVLEHPPAAYSEAGRLAKIEGFVRMALTIDTDGRPRNIRLVRSLGFGLDEAAYETLRKWRFRPSARQGQAVPANANVEINFRLL